VLKPAHFSFSDARDFCRDRPWAKGEKMNYPISRGCCDNVHIFGQRYHCRCNDGIAPLPLWKRLVQAAFSVHRENTSWDFGAHEIKGWRLSILKAIIKPAPGDAPWRWIVTK